MCHGHAHFSGLAGGFNFFLFSPLPTRRNDSQFDLRIFFQMGWFKNHQRVVGWELVFLSPFVFLSQAKLKTPTSQRTPQKDRPFAGCRCVGRTGFLSAIFKKGGVW